MSYKLFHVKTGEPLGRASSKENLGELIMDLFYDDGIFPSLVRVEEEVDE